MAGDDEGKRNGDRRPAVAAGEQGNEQGHIDHAHHDAEDRRDVSLHVDLGGRVQVGTLVET